MATGIVRVNDAVYAEISQVRAIAKLARTLGVSERALRREFKNREGLTLSKYRTQVRIKRAKDLLLRSEMSCKEILLSVGFSHADVGARAFKRYAGLTMKQYRSEARRTKEGGVSMPR